MRAQYARTMENRDDESRHDEQRQIEKLLTMWNGRVAWWERKFSPSASYKKDQPGSENGHVPGRLQRPIRLPAQAYHVSVPSHRLPRLLSQVRLLS